MTASSERVCTRANASTHARTAMGRCEEGEKVPGVVDPLVQRDRRLGMAGGLGHLVKSEGRDALRSAERGGMGARNRTG